MQAHCPTIWKRLPAPALLQVLDEGEPFLPPCGTRLTERSTGTVMT